MADLPGRARVVVIGGGVIGTSVAYHLTREGWTDVVLLEQGSLAGGTTWHAAGLVGLLRASVSGTRLVQDSVDLYQRLEAETGLATGYKQCGGVIVARTEERMTALRRTAAAGAAYGLDAEMISPAEALERYPVMAVDDLLGALWLPQDGKANPTDLTQALAKGARQGGARVFEKTRVLGISTEDGRVTGVSTDRGDIEAEVVVNAAGQWAKAVGELCGVSVPLHSAEHFYVVTDQIDGVHPDLPIMRDPDGYTYFKEEVGGLVVGGFEPVAKPWVSPDQIPHPFEFQLLEEDWDHFSILMDNALVRIPALEQTGIRKFYNGPESFTPDNQFLLGEAPEVRNFFVAAASTPSASPRAAAPGRRWRSGSSAASRPRTSAASTSGGSRGSTATTGGCATGSARSWVCTTRCRGRTARCRPRGPSAARRPPPARGGRCALGQPDGMGAGQPLRAAGLRGRARMGKAGWLPLVAEECEAVRERVAVFDQTSFSKYLVTGTDALALLQRLCTADVDVPVGRAVYTGLLNSRGTYEADLTVTRTSASEFLLVSSSASTERDLDWLRRHVRGGEHVAVVDLTSSMAVYGVMGPRSRDLLAGLSDADLSDGAFGFGTSRMITLGYATVRATRITYVGELGWELYVPTEFAVGVYEDLLSAGESVGVAPAGYYAIEALRLEKGYRAFGRELNPDHNPVEAGLTFACKLDTDVPFLGREAVERARADGVRQRLLSFALEDPEAMIWGGELVVSDGQPVGQITSAAFGPTVGACVALGYVWEGDGSVLSLARARERSYHVEVGGELVPARVSTRPLVDPDNSRIR